MNKAELIAKIKSAKKYKHISEEVIASILETYAKKDLDWQIRKPEFILKKVKSQLHQLHGSFRPDNIKKREKVLERLKENPRNQELVQEILETNNSTKERLSIYPRLYKQIFRVTGKPRSIVDLGAGINPISLNYMGLESKEISYDAYDINEHEAFFINEFFKSVGINGKAHVLDVSNLSNISKIPDSDICFMFKFLDPIEKFRNDHRLSEDIIELLRKKCKFIVASFSTNTLCGKIMNHPYRGWVERMLTRIGLDFQMLDFSEDAGEFFYIIIGDKK